MAEQLGTHEDVPVVLAGGGLIGLSMSMFLAQHGIPSLAIEPLRGGSHLPRAAFFHMRTLEMFRAAGIEDEVREQAFKELSRKARSSSWTRSRAKSSPTSSPV